MNTWSHSIRVGHSPDFLLSRYCHDCAESDVKCFRAYVHDILSSMILVSDMPCGSQMQPGIGNVLTLQKNPSFDWVFWRFHLFVPQCCRWWGCRARRWHLAALTVHSYVNTDIVWSGTAAWRASVPIPVPQLPWSMSQTPRRPPLTYNVRHSPVTRPAPSAIVLPGWDAPDASATDVPYLNAPRPARTASSATRTTAAYADVLVRLYYPWNVSHKHTNVEPISQ